MKFTKLLKCGAKWSTVLLSTSVAFSQFANADFTRSCPASFTVTATTMVGTNRTSFPLRNRSIVPEITMKGSPSGSKKNRLKRKGAKKLSSYAATECVNQWISRAIKAFNSGQVRGKIVPPGVCKDPDRYVKFNDIGRQAIVTQLNKKKFDTTDASVSRMRWAYNTRDDAGFYDFLEAACDSHGPGLLVQIKTDMLSRDGECKTSNGKSGWYLLSCDGRTPKKLVSRGSEF